MFSEVGQLTRSKSSCLSLSGYEHLRELEVLEEQEDRAHPLRRVPSRLSRSRLLLMDREQDLEVVSQAGSVAEGGIDTAIVDVPLPDEGMTS